MDLDKALVSAVLAEGKEAFARAKSRGAFGDRIQGEGKIALDFVEKFYTRYGKLPSADLVLGPTGIDLEDALLPPGVVLGAAEGPADYFIEEVNNRFLYGRLRETVSLTLDVLQKSPPNPQEAYKTLKENLDKMREALTVGSPVDSLFKLGPEIKSYYERIERGERGILTPWNSVNEATLGFWPEDLVLFVARIGVGKSWLAVLLAQHAHSLGKRVLFITTEVSQLRIGMRFFAAKNKVPYGLFTHGRLDGFTKERVFKAIDEVYHTDGMYLIGGDFDFAISSVEAAIDACKPDFVVIDGVYLLKVGGHNRTERMANAFDEVKRLAKRKRLPMAITTQFNREVKKNMKDTVQLESIAMSDVGGWNADLVYGLVQTDEMRTQRQMSMKPLKVREGSGMDLIVSWNFETMNFSELKSVGGGGGDADEFKTGDTDPLQDNQNPDTPPDDLPF